MNRRTYLAAALSTVALGGCSSALRSAQQTPDPDHDPLELLPDPSEEWEQTDSESAFSDIPGVIEGARGRYAGPDGEEYTAAVLKWADSDTASENMGRWFENDWTVSLSNGVFGFASDGPDEERAKELLAASSALVLPVVEANA